MSDDVLDVRREGRCPRCNATLMSWELDPETGEMVDHMGDDWCPGCGWSSFDE